MNQMSLNYQKCECHDCTQARWKMSFQGQLAGQAIDQSNSALEAAKQQQYSGQSIVGVR